MSISSGMFKTDANDPRLNDVAKTSISFSLSDDANIEEVIRNLPGVEIDNDGNITVNGKRVNRVLVNGKELNPNKTEQAEPASNATKSIDENGNITIDTQNGIRVYLNGTQVAK